MEEWTVVAQGSSEGWKYEVEIRTLDNGQVETRIVPAPHEHMAISGAFGRIEDALAEAQRFAERTIRAAQVSYA
ncbi:hypothetical protein E4695_06635 [Alcaligenaceae bacterium 429]|jgi:hypothetical protein|uniref:hypothetical protein n=1 Tax=Paenalcaligenes sp. Me52 TaxID=3392038 RepID=UPI001092E560|nr:hypothetical protein E4695_06635 [Alcaligenaceae bacterium 429]